MRAGGSSAFITKLLSTFAGHSRTTIVPFYPKLASWTLFVLGSIHEFDEVFIVFVEAIVDFVLSTSHTVVVLTLAP